MELYWPDEMVHTSVFVCVLAYLKATQLVSVKEIAALSYNHVNTQHQNVLECVCLNVLASGATLTLLYFSFQGSSLEILIAII